jgi:6-pyruvoyl-tetrahydropterin synthase related domain
VKVESRPTDEKTTAPSVLRPPDFEIRRRFAGAAVVLAAATVAIAPQLVRGNSCGHDFDVHLVSWLDCANAWRHGIVYPHWTPSPNWSAGEPRFVFYPPLTWMLGALLGLISSWHFAPIALTFLCLAGTGLATRALALEACSDAVATLAGCAALFSGFTLFTAYERAAFPEFTGGVWLPLLLLFALRDRHPFALGLRRAFDGSTVPLALALAACWLSNAPLGVIASYLLAAVALLAAVQKKSWAPALRAAVATALGLGITAFYWIPAAWEQRWVDIRQATQDPGYNFENNWVFAHHANPLLALHDQVLHTASWISLSMIVVALVCLAVAQRRGMLTAEKNTGLRRWWIPLAAIPCVTLFLLFPISRPVWQLLPKFKFLQYPWRWMEAVEAPMGLFFAAAVWPRGRRAQRAVAAVCAAAFLAATAYAATQFFQVCYPEDAVPAVLADYRAGAGFEGMYEYEPPKADITLIAMGLPDACLVSDPAAALGKVDPDSDNLAWSASQGSCLATFPFAGGRATNPEHLRIRADASQGGFLVLRLLSYPAWTIRVNGKPVGKPAASLPHRDDGLLAVPVPRGSSDVSIDWTTTPDVLLSRWVSLLGVLALTAVGLLERKIRRSQVS